MKKGTRATAKASWSAAALVVVVAVLAAVLALAGCQKKTTDGDSDQTKAVNTTLTLGLESEAFSMDPIYSYDYGTTAVVQVTESLLYYDNQDQLQPGLVESWQQVDDTTYTYQVRQNVTFSDGSAMTMEDVLYSLERYRDPDLASDLSWMYDSVDTITQTGDWEFTVKLKAPDATWKHVFATTGGHVQKKSFVEAAGDANGTPAGGILGTGPYKVTDWDSTSQMVMEYNPNYWNAATDGEPDVKKIVIQFITEDATRVLASTSGQIDLNLGTPVEMVEDVRKSDQVNLIEKPSMGLYFLAFNCQKPPFDDVNVRRAISSAFDAQVIQDSIVKDCGTLTNYLPIPATLYSFEKDSWTEYEKTANKYPYDLDKAKEYLSKSAYPDGFDCEIVVDERGVFNSVTLYMQQQLKKIGINVKINKLSNDEVVTWQLGGGIKDGVRPYDMLQAEWGADYPDPSGDLTPLFDSSGIGDGGSNTSAYSNKEVDRLLDEQAASSDDAERTRLMQEALDIIVDEAPAYVWTHQNYLWTVNKRVSGLEDLSGNWFWSIYFKNLKLSE
ncbi:MAG: ABC transporter substrate-binding protein [Actinomycetes bacterium]|jgi:peptide/nickel transport system substrate-binding protein|nr:ABC transporter substrate-binding protein [Actinomycetes bacterium]